jgi:predicted lipoprotein with Yx(FWY)xxD motif
MTPTRPITFLTSPAAMPLSAWPPLLAAGPPDTGCGLTVFALQTITPSAGGQQVTYTGHPVYPYIGDK